MSYDFKLQDNDLSINKTGDIILSKTKIELSRQWVQIRLKTILTEWFLDQNQGVDWFNLLSRRNTRAEIDSVVKRVIVTTKYITKILTYSGGYNPETQKYSINFSAGAEGGEVITINNLEIT